VHNQKAYLISAAVAVLAAGGLTLFTAAGPLPVLGSFPLLPAVLLMAVLGMVAISYLVHRDVPCAETPSAMLPLVARVAGLGALLAIPPILIDMFLPFPQSMNLPLPDALYFYPAIALVAEVQFHLFPLALLALVLPRTVSPILLVLPVVLIEPLFQVFFLQGFTLQTILVLFNVGLISACQMWLFLRYGYGAMFGLRIAFYLFWHIIWGALRLQLLF